MYLTERLPGPLYDENKTAIKNFNKNKSESKFKLPKLAGDSATKNSKSTIFTYQY